MAVTALVLALMVGKKSLSLVPISLAAVLTQNKHQPLILSEVSQL